MGLQQLYEGTPNEEVQLRENSLRIAGTPEKLAQWVRTPEPSAPPPLAKPRRCLLLRQIHPLCHTLVQSGLLCYSDDSACLTTDYQIAGMPFALALRESPRFCPSHLGNTSPIAPPKALIFVNYQATPKPPPGTPQPLRSPPRTSKIRLLGRAH